MNIIFIFVILIVEIYAAQATLEITTTVCSGANSVRMTGPWWEWATAGGPMAVSNDDNTWTFTFETVPDKSMEYLLVVDGVQEDLVTAGKNTENWSCTPITDEETYANRQWKLGSENVANTYGTCGNCVTGTVNIGAAQNLTPAQNLFISEVAEGSSNNKYFEIFNPTASDIDLADYAFARVSNGPDIIGQYDSLDNFVENATIAAGDVFVVCHPEAHEEILEECDQHFKYLSNGDDGLCLTKGEKDDPEYFILDCVGDFIKKPYRGWDVAGNSTATKDHTLVRKTSVIEGNAGAWTESAGTSTEDSEWIVRKMDDWTNIGEHFAYPVVKISVDASNITVGSLYIGGGATGMAQAFQMVDNDGIWTADVTFNVTFVVLPGFYTILNSPVNDSDWDTKEDLSGLPCGYGENNDRIMTYNDYANGYKNITFGNCQLHGPCVTTDCVKLRECYNTAPCSCGSTNPTCISYKTAFDAKPCCA